jgi:FkbM family methyltransferase
MARTCGVEISRYSPDEKGKDPFSDMQRLLAGWKAPVVFDVGANVGQSVALFKEAFPSSVIHSFEPSPTTFQLLSENCRNVPSFQAWNYGVGSQEATLALLESERSDMSSFLAPSTTAGCHVAKVTEVPVVTLDSFADQQGIDFIHVLKSDTQGYDFEVFKGASRLMQENKIGLIYFEFIFSDMYKGLPKFHEVFRYLSENNFDLVTFYDSHFQEDLVSWTDALLINRKFREKR